MGDTIDPPDKVTDIVVRGVFVDAQGTPIDGAAVHERFLGNPPSNCGTHFDLTDAPARTEAMGRFQFALQDLDRRHASWATPGSWRRGCFLILAVKDARTLGYVIASGEELIRSPVRIACSNHVDLSGTLVDGSGLPIRNALIVVERYMMFVARGPWPNAPINFWLSRTIDAAERRFENVEDLRDVTEVDGRFCIAGVPAIPGLLRLAITHPSYAKREVDFQPYQPPMRLTLKPAASVVIHVSLPIDQPAVEFALHLEGVPDGETDCTHRDSETDSAGVCVLDGLLAGSYVVRYLGGADKRFALPAIVVPDLREGERREILVRALPGSVLCGTNS